MKDIIIDTTLVVLSLIVTFVVSTHLLMTAFNMLNNN